MIEQKYVEKIIEALSLERPKSNEDVGFHHTGSVQPDECPAAVDAAVALFLARNKKRLDLFPELITQLCDKDILTFSEYCAALARIDKLKDRFSPTHINRRIQLNQKKIRAIGSEAYSLDQERKGKIRAADAKAHTLRTQASYASTPGSAAVIHSRINNIEPQTGSIERRIQSKEKEKAKLEQEILFMEEDLKVAPAERKYRNLALAYDLNTHTADHAGYLAYLQTAAPTLRNLLQKRLPAYLREADRQAHTYITAGTGAGKSEFLKTLIYSYLTKSGTGSQVIIDPHSDFALQVAQWPESLENDRLVYINTSYTKCHPTLNPFDLNDLSETSIEIRAEQLSSVFQELIRKSGFSELTGNMKALLIPTIATLLRIPGTSLADLQTFMDDAQNKELHQKGLRSPFATHRDFFHHHFYSDHFKSTKQALYVKLMSLLNSPSRRRLFTGKNTIDLEQLTNAGKLIIFNLPLGGGEEISQLFGSFILAILQGLAMQRFKTPPKQRVPIHVFVDECQNYLTDRTKTILTGSRKFGLHLTLAQQFYGQDMDPDLAKTVLGNTAIKVVGWSQNFTLMEKGIGVNQKAIAALGKGEFFIKVAGQSSAFKIYGPTNLLGNRHRVSPKKWNAVMQEQFEKYYQPAGPQTPLGKNDDNPNQPALEPLHGKEDFV